MKKTKFKKGDSVNWQDLKGYVIEDSNTTISVFPIIVKFNNNKILSFMADGSIYENTPPVLSHTPYTLNGFSQNEVNDWEFLETTNPLIKQDIENTKKQTAVEFIVKELIKLGYLHSSDYSQSPNVTKVIEQAKEMERQQFISTFDGHTQCEEDNKDKKYTEEDSRIIKIYNKRLKKYWECSYGAFLKRWGNNGWAVVNK
jgi:hypothetical protein